MNDVQRTGNEPFGGYYKPKERSVDEELSRVGPGTPCGEYLRRFWHPILMSDRLADRPLPLRILGEDLVLFRDLSGDIGLVHKHCSHRGMSLEFGIIANHGIRCAYHGWCYGTDGRILETPGESPKSKLTGAYLPWRLPGRRVQGIDLRVLRSAGAQAGVSPAGHDGTAGQRDGAVADSFALQLAAGEREFDGSVPHAVPAYTDVGRAIRGDLGRAPGRGLPRARARVLLYQRAPQRRQHLGPRPRSSPPQLLAEWRAVRARRNGALFWPRQPYAMGRADRRHEYSSHRMAQPEPVGRPGAALQAGGNRLGVRRLLRPECASSV